MTSITVYFDTRAEAAEFHAAFGGWMRRLADGYAVTYREDAPARTWRQQ